MGGWDEGATYPNFQHPESTILKIVAKIWMLRLLFPTFYCSSAVPICIFKEEYSNNHINWPCKVRYSEKVPMWIRRIKISVCVYDQFKSDVFLRMQSEIFQDYPGRGGKPGIFCFFFTLCINSSALDYSATAPPLIFLLNLAPFDLLLLFLRLSMLSL